MGTFNGSFSGIVYPEDATKHFVGLVFSVSQFRAYGGIKAC